MNTSAPDVSKKPITTLIGELSVPQLWKLVGTMLGVLAITFSAGVYSGEWHKEREKDVTIDLKNKEIDQLTTDLGTQATKHENSINSLKSSNSQEIAKKDTEINQLQLQLTTAKETASRLGSELMSAKSTTAAVKRQQIAYKLQQEFLTNECFYLLEKVQVIQKKANFPQVRDTQTGELFHVSPRSKHFVSQVRDWYTRRQVMFEKYGINVQRINKKLTEAYVSFPGTGGLKLPIPAEVKGQALK